MDLVNTSGFEAAMLRIDLGIPEITAVVIVKSTFEVADDGTIMPAAEPMPLVKQLLETPFGVFHDEHYFKKIGVDLCILGTVRRSRPVTEARVRMTCGARQWELLVTGDRRWVPHHAGQLVPSRTVPFSTMPLGYAHAFGGQVPMEELAYAYPANPKGRGFYRTVAEAEGQPLPNIVDPRAPLIVWRAGDQRPVGWAPYPNFWALRATDAVGHDRKTGALLSLSPSLFNNAHPDLVLDAINQDDEIAIDGLLERPVRARVPAPPAKLVASIGQEQRDIDAPIDGLFFWTDERKLVVTQRARFRYPLRPEEKRSVHILRAGLRD